MDESYYGVTQSVPSNLNEITVAHLLDPAFNPDQVLWELSFDQLGLIEKTLIKVKKKRLDILGYNKDGRVTKPVFTGATLGENLAKSLSPQRLDQSDVMSKDPTTFVRDGIEWVSFYYSHNRCLQKYEIRTDVEKVNLKDLSPSFKQENCVYPRAFCTQDKYKGNRWAYETECNHLGWKLAYLNLGQIGGKRGLIQRAVDSYRNRYPSLRSRRVTRQEKIMNGTLRRRRPRGATSSVDCSSSCTSTSSSDSPQTTPNSDTLIYQDLHTGKSWSLRINLDNVDMNEIDAGFKQRNCVFPRSAFANKDSYTNPRKADEATCNEIAWKLAWLNPQLLTGKKGKLQRALDLYRSKFITQLKPRPGKRKLESCIRPPSEPSSQEFSHALQPILSSPGSSITTTDSVTTSVSSFEDLFYTPNHSVDYIISDSIPATNPTSDPTAQPCLTAEQLLSQLMK